MIAAGRTRLAFGNERFVGPVGWRQSQQSFDGVSLRTTAIARTSLTLARLRDVRKPNGARQGIEGNLAFAEIGLDRAGPLSPYWIDLDFDDPALAAVSTSRIGAAWVGRWGCCRDWTVPFRAEWATQSDAGANPANLDADYTRFELGASRDEWTLTGIAETLGGGADAGGSFSTPRATLHAFNGWADVFVGGTPPDGLEDRALKLAWAKGAWSASAIYHEFSAEATDEEYGTEFDAQVVRECDSGARIGLTMASYDAESFAVDVRKLWLWATYRF